MSSIIDIHPHIVSPDTKKYPLDPLGGTQSTWSTERPTTYDDLLRAMDEAGVAKAAIVHSSTAYGYDNSYVADAVAAVPSRFTGVYLDRCAGARRGEDLRLLARPRLQRHAPVHHRKHVARPGHFVRRSQELPLLGARGREKYSGLHADEAGRYPSAAPDHGQVSEGDDSSSIICPARRSRTVRPMPALPTSLHSRSTSRSISRSRRSTSRPRRGARARRRHSSAR